MNKIRVTVELELISDMFSAGADKDKPEFRITEIKALLRATFREFFEYSGIDDMEKKQEILFGSTSKKSPVVIRLQEKAKNIKIGKAVFIEHKKLSSNAILKGSKISFVLESYNEAVLDIYIYLLKLASITGGLGKRSRKGKGAFQINSMKKVGTEMNITLDEILKKNPIEKIIEEGKQYIYKIRGSEKKQDKSYRGDIYEVAEPKDIDIHYAKRIHIMEMKISPKEKDKADKVLKSVSQLTHDRLLITRWKDPKTTEKEKSEFKKQFSLSEKEIFSINPDILGNCRQRIQRFASPVYITLYKEKGKLYMVIKELNYQYIYAKPQDKEKGKLQHKQNDQKYISKYINAIKRECGVKR